MELKLTSCCLSYLSHKGRSSHSRKSSIIQLESHLDVNPAYAYYNAVCIFDPQQLAIVEHNIADYEVIPGLQCLSTELHEEWLIYMRLPPSSVVTSTTIPAFWKGMTEHYPLLSAIAIDAVWIPVTSVDYEHSFSQYKHILNDRGVRLTEENTKRLLTLYHNGDIEGHLNGSLYCNTNVYFVHTSLLKWKLHKVLSMKWNNE